MMQANALKTALATALRITENAPTLDQQLTAGDLFRSTAARRLSDAHEKLVREAKTLADDAASLVATLQCDGIGARLSGHTFARSARKVSGALIRLGECRDAFEAMTAHADLGRLLGPAPEQSDVAPEEDRGDEREEDETED